MSELNIKDFKSKYKPIGLSMELNFQGQSAYETGKIGGHTPLYTDEQIQDYLKNKPQLTIPKSIADELDKVPNEAKRYVQENGFDDYSILDDFVELREFYEADEDEAFPRFTGLKEFVKDNLNLCALYLAGKALGIDLVKVV